jgi:hypothetical protein
MKTLLRLSSLFIAAIALGVEMTTNSKEGDCIVIILLWICYILTNTEIYLEKK